MFVYGSFSRLGLAQKLMVLMVLFFLACPGPKTDGPDISDPNVTCVYDCPGSETKGPKGRAIVIIWLF